MEPIHTVELEHISRVFETKADRSRTVTRFVALDDVSLPFFRGELQIILGENGAGKSTLVHILSGLHKPTSGRILLDGREVLFDAPADALSRGIAMVHQRPLLADDLTVLENVALGSPDILVRRNKLRARVRELAAEWNCAVDFDAVVRTLNPADRLKTALLCALSTNPSFLILDEPTAILPPEARESFMEILVKNADRGMGIVVITHKMGEAARHGHRIAILKHGKLVRRIDQRKTPVAEAELSGLFTLQTDIHPVRQSPEGAENQEQREPSGNRENIDRAQCTVPFAVSDLSAVPPNRQGLESVSFSAKPGAITGILAYPGSGLDTLEDVLSGMLTPASGTIILPGGENRCTSLDAAALTPGLLRHHGVAIVPSNRTTRGAHPDISIRDALIPYYSGKFSSHAADRFAQTMVRKEEIADHPFRPVRTISGGQLQKLILSRELSVHPRVLILADPEWGLDVASVYRLRQRLRATAAEGVAVLILTDTPDTMEVTDFFTGTYTLREGKLT